MTVIRSHIQIKPIAEKMNAKPTTMEMFPDSGCQETLVSADLMDYLGLELDRRRKKGIKGIYGKTYVPCLGSTEFQVTYDRQQINVLAHVMSGLSNEVVLSWRTLQRLCIVLEDYPRSQLKKANKAEVQSPGRAAQGSQNNEGADGPADGIDLEEGFKGLSEKSKMVSKNKNEKEDTSWPAIHLPQKIARLEGIPGTQKLADDILVI